MYPYGLIGNCQVSALISDRASIDWLCFPRPDSPPVFGKLLDKNGGFFCIELEGQKSSEQRYLHNSNILETILTDDQGSSIRILDFCPRFNQFGRIFRPHSVFRIIEPLQGTALMRVHCKPINGWEKEAVHPIRGNSHLRYDIRGESMRLTTNMSLTYLLANSRVAVQEKIYFALTWGGSVDEDVIEVSERFLRQTEDYWRGWVQHCSIPAYYQSQTIRSALALKLHCYEDTGAIFASITTSLPEEWGGERNWDYRLCWLRDSYYILTAFYQLGHFEEVEGFLRFLAQIATRFNSSDDRLHPVYMLDQNLPLPEMSLDHWEGYRGSKPVRYNNQAAEHVQNDAYGEMILTLSPIFFDERFYHLRTRNNQALLETLGRFAADSINKPDAGLWELRDGWQDHTFTNMMSWAGLERISRIQKLGYLKNLDFDVTVALKKAEAAIRSAVVDGSLRNGPSDATYDSSMLQLPLLNFPDTELCRKTVEAIAASLVCESGRKNSGRIFISLFAAR